MYPRRQRKALVIVCFSLWTASAQTSDTNPVNTTQPPSSCEVCRDTGDCQLASAGQSPGQFCYNWVDRASRQRPCCCPLDAYCLKTSSQYECQCTYTKHVTFKDTSPENNTQDTTYISIGLGVGGVLGFCMGACTYHCFCTKRKNVSPNGPNDGGKEVAVGAIGGFGMCTDGGDHGGDFGGDGGDGGGDGGGD